MIEVLIRLVILVGIYTVAWWLGFDFDTGKAVEE